MLSHINNILLFLLLALFPARGNTTYASHRVATLFPLSQSEETALTTWNANGELTSIVQPLQDRFRRHLWNEAGQLALSVSNEYCGYYAYDARGERAYKLTGVVFTDQYDAGTIQATVSFDDAVLYVNPYMVVTPRGYTKHYYNGSQRIAARIGGYWHDESVFVSSPALTNTAESLWAATLYKEELREQETPFDEVYVSPVGVFLPVAQYGPVVANLSGMHADDLLSSVFSGHNSEQLDYDTVGIYFYHSDHLGSANWITNSQGEAVQYLHYMPFGELWADQQFYAYDERYKFTGKERDTETGYDYFGARYYASALPMWLSVDPLANEYPDTNPYAYCAWNPIKYIDPNGKVLDIAWDIANIVLDIYSLQSNISQGNVADAVIDGAGLLLDVAAAALPFVPGGAGTALKAYRTADKVKDAVNAQKVTKSTRVLENAKKGADFERKVGEKLGKNTASQVTIEVKDGTKTRMDFVSIEDGNIKLTEAKSSATAPLTQNQRTAHPQIEQYGGTIKGNNGNSVGLPNGTDIPPTKVDIVRPNNLVD